VLLHCLHSLLVEMAWQALPGFKATTARSSQQCLPGLPSSQACPICVVGARNTGQPRRRGRRKQKEEEEGERRNRQFHLTHVGRFSSDSVGRVWFSLGTLTAGDSLRRADYPLILEDLRLWVYTLHIPPHRLQRLHADSGHEQPLPIYWGRNIPPAPPPMHHHACHWGFTAFLP